MSLFRKYLFVGRLFIPQCRKLFFMLLLCSLLTAVFTAVLPMVLGAMTRSLRGENIQENDLLWLFDTPMKITVLFACLSLANIAMSFLSGIVDRRFQNDLTQKIKYRLHQRFMTFDARYYDQHDSSEALFNIEHSVAVIGAISLLFVQPVSCMTGILLGMSGLVSALAHVQMPGWLILCIIAALLVYPFVSYWLGRKINASFGQLRASSMTLYDEMLNSFKAPTEIQLLNAEKQRNAAILSALTHVVSASNKANVWATLHSQFSPICILFFQALIAFSITLFYLKDDGMEATGTLVTSIMLIPVLFNQVSSFTVTYIQAKQAQPEVETVYRLLTMEPEIQDTPHAVPFDKANGNLQIHSLNFGYAKEKMVLQHMDFHVPEGKTLAIVAKSGGGKSTLLQLLSRLYDPSDGYIVLGNKELRDYTLSSLRDAIVRVSQFPLFIQGTIRDNLRLQKEDASDEDMENACKKAGIWNALVNNSSGNPLDYRLTLGAENLSGGQRRLLAIARATLKEPVMLLLDEPTTGIDAQTVQNVVAPVLKEYKKEAAMIIVDHNMNFVRNMADMVLVLENGTVADFGPTEEVLAKKDSLFRKLWEEYNKKPLSSP